MPRRRRTVLSDVLESEPEVQNKQGALASFAPQGRVAFEGVTFSYDGDGQDPVLKGLDFVAEPGQTIAILGATGSGKSSLIHLIPRFYDVTGGQVTIDGVDVRDVDKAALRRQYWRGAARVGPVHRDHPRQHPLWAS